MSQTLSSNKRIAKNTVFLYIRMIIVMIVSLYTTRVILEVLGVSNYGIYNIIGGVVVLFSFLNNALSSATQRYLSFALGKSSKDLFDKYYSASIISYIGLAILIIILAESLGLWFVNTKLSIPDNRMVAANVVYQLTIVTFIVNLFRIPFEAAVISHERMSFYAYLSVADVILKLCVVFLLFIASGDKLIDYAILMTLIPVGITFFFAIFCHHILKCEFSRIMDFAILKDLFSFSGWTLIGGLANVATRQGGNILINIFFGVTVNAAFGIANQVNTAVNSFVSNFQTAFRPQIVKLYASGEREDLNRLIFRTSKWSYYLLLIIVLPLSFNINEILSIWLENVPQYSNIFIICLFIYCLIDSFQAPLIFNITATGNIKIYQIWLSAILILNLPISYLFLRNGYPPYIFFIVYVSLNFITSIIRTIYMKYLVEFPIRQYFIKVIVPIIQTTVVSLFVSLGCSMFIKNNNISFFISSILIFCITLLVIISVGMDKTERRLIINLIYNKILKIQKSK